MVFRAGKTLSLSDFPLDMYYVLLFLLSPWTSPTCRWHPPGLSSAVVRGGAPVWIFLQGSDGSCLVRHCVFDQEVARHQPGGLGCWFCTTDIQKNVAIVCVLTVGLLCSSRKQFYRYFPDDAKRTLPEHETYPRVAGTFCLETTYVAWIDIGILFILDASWPLKLLLLFPSSEQAPSRRSWATL